MRTVKGVAKASSSLLGEDPLAFLGSSICMPTCRNKKMQNGQLLRLSLLCPQALCWLVLNIHISSPSVFLWGRVGKGWYSSWTWAGNHTKAKPVLAVWFYSKAGFRMATVPNVVAQAWNPGTGEAEAGVLL